MITTAGRSRATLPLCAAALLIAGCSGKDGPTGPQGPAGNANVSYSPWFTPSRYDTATVFGTMNFSYIQAAPQITQAVMDNGVVLTYGKLSGYDTRIWPATQVGLLPITLTYVQGVTQIDTWSAYPTPGNLRITFVNNTNLYSWATINTLHSFRYVIIPGGASANIVASSGISANRAVSANVAGPGYTRAQLQSMSYEEIRRVFNIPEN
jgi:hypothetical protein